MSCGLLPGLEAVVMIAEKRKLYSLHILNAAHSVQQERVWCAAGHGQVATALLPLLGRPRGAAWVTP